MFVSGIHSLYCENSKPPLPTRSLNSAISAVNHGCTMPIPSLQLQKKPVICREAEGLVAELWSPRFVTIQWLCSQLCYVTAANQRTIVEIELLATVSWKWGWQPFSCQCSQNVMHCRKEINATCLFKESIPTIPCVNSKHPIPTRSLRFFLRAAACSTGSASWLHHAQAFIATAEKACLMQRSGASSLSAIYVHKMWSTAEKRLTRHVCLRNPCFCGNHVEI